MERATLFIQCNTPNGETGDFLATGRGASMVLYTPVFSSLSPLFDYLAANGWRPVPNSLQPTGEYERESN